MRRIIVETYGKVSISERTSPRIFEFYKSGNFDIEDKKYLGAVKSLKTQNWRHY